MSQQMARDARTKHQNRRLKDLQIEHMFWYNYQTFLPLLTAQVPAAQLATARTWNQGE